MMRAHTLMLYIVIGGVACSTDVPEFQARLEANVTGDITVYYEGDAQFNAAYNPNTELPFFELGSENRPLVGLPTDGYEGIHVSGSRGRPKVGSYPAGIWPSSLGEDGPLWFMYQRAINGKSEQYTSIDGSVEITHSSSSRLEGTFDVRALLFCLRTQGSAAAESIEEGSCYPADLDYALPTIRVVGSFTARRISDHGEVINQSRVQGWQ